MLHESPPTARYKYTLVITGNTLDEIEREVLVQTRGEFLLDSDRYTRNAFEVHGGRSTRKLEHVNPEMTPERYDTELDAWWKARKNSKRS